MVGRKKKFIEKDEGVKFVLAHRSQRDPLYLDESLGERVLVPVDEEKYNSSTSKQIIESMNNLKLGHRTRKEIDDLKRKRVEEQHKYGIYYDDDYDYLQHLRDVDSIQEAAQLEHIKAPTIKPKPVKIGSVVIKDEDDDEQSHHDQPTTSRVETIIKPKLQLPSTVFASKFEEDVGYFNQAAPNSDPKFGWDPDVVRMLDDETDVDFESEDNLLEDDFIMKANCTDDEENDDGEEYDDDETLTEKSQDYDTEDLDDDEDYEEDEDQFSESQSVKEFETKSRFSSYSMTSSVVRRNESLKTIDEQFERFYAQYDDDQIGALDTEDIEGFRRGNDLVLESALQEFDKFVKKQYYEKDPEGNHRVNAESNEIEEGEDMDESNDEDENNNQRDYEFVKYTKRKDKEDRLDCESVLSTYSNIYNRPAVISDREEKKSGGIQLSAKTGLPLGVLPEKAKGQRELDRIEHRITRIMPEIPKRGDNESKEEKKARKQAVKEHKRERRIEKKINKTAFKEEKKFQVTQMTNARETGHTIKLPL